MAQATNGNRTNKGYVERVESQTQGKAIGSLELWVNSTTVRTVNSTDRSGQPVQRELLNVNTVGHFAGWNGVAYALGDDVFADGEAVFVNVTMAGALKERFEKLNLGKGALVRFYGTFARDEFTGRDGQQRVSVNCNARQFELIWRKNENAAKPTTAASEQKQTTPPPATQPQTPTATTAETLGDLTDDDIAEFDFQ